MTPVIQIDDPDDPRIEPFRDIRERDLVRRGGFIVEGTVVLRSLLDSPLFAPDRLLVLANRLARLEAALARLPPGVPVYVAERPVLDAVAGFALHRGVLAYGVARPGKRLPLRARLEAIAAEGGVAVVAVGIANHDNVGGIFRNAAAFAAGAVLLDGTSCDPLYRKALRVSAGAVLGMPFERVEPFAALTLLRDAGFRTVALSPQGNAGLSGLDRPGPVALFVGSEGEGLPENLLAAMETVRIDMAPGFRSLNVATSAAIALQRLYSARGGA